MTQPSKSIVKHTCDSIKNEVKLEMEELLHQNIPNLQNTTNSRWKSIHKKIESVYKITSSHRPVETQKKNAEQWIERTLCSTETKTRQDGEEYKRPQDPAKQEMDRGDGAVINHIVNDGDDTICQPIQWGINDGVLKYTNKNKGRCKECEEKLQSKEGQFCYNKLCVHPGMSIGCPPFHDECLIPLNHSTKWVCSVCVFQLARQKYSFEDTGNQFVEDNHADIARRNGAISCIFHFMRNGNKYALFTAESNTNSTRHYYIVLPRVNMYNKQRRKNRVFRNAFEVWLDKYRERANRSLFYHHHERIPDFGDGQFPNLSVQTMTKRCNGGMRMWMAIDGVVERDGNLMKQTIPYCLGHMFDRDCKTFMKKEASKERNDVDPGAYYANNIVAMYYQGYSYKYSQSHHFKSAFRNEAEWKVFTRAPRAHYELASIPNKVTSDRNEHIVEQWETTTNTVNAIVQHLALKPRYHQWKSFRASPIGMMAFLGYTQQQNPHSDAASLFDQKKDNPQSGLMMVNLCVNVKFIRFQSREEIAEREITDAKEEEKEEEGTRYFDVNWTDAERERCSWLQNGRWTVGPSMQSKVLCFRSLLNRCPSVGITKGFHLKIGEGTIVLAGGFDVCTVTHQAHDIQGNTFTLLGTTRQLTNRLKAKAEDFSKDCSEIDGISLIE